MAFMIWFSRGGVPILPRGHGIRPQELDTGQESPIWREIGIVFAPPKRSRFETGAFARVLFASVLFRKNRLTYIDQMLYYMYSERSGRPRVEIAGIGSVLDSGIWLSLNVPGGGVFLAYPSLSNCYIQYNRQYRFCQPFYFKKNFHFGLTNVQKSL